MAQRRSAVLSIHMRIWFANHLVRSCIRGFTIHNAVRMFMLDTHPLCCENNTSPPVANFACYVCIHALPGWSFLDLQCSWIVQERFEPGISFITCSNNIWKPFFALLKNCYAWTINVFTMNPSIVVLLSFLLRQAEQWAYGLLNISIQFKIFLPVLCRWLASFAAQHSLEFQLPSIYLQHYRRCSKVHLELTHICLKFPSSFHLSSDQSWPSGHLPVW